MNLRKSPDRERLADALAAPQWEDLDVAECPPPAQLWRASAGQLTVTELAEMADHASRCAVCAHDMKAAHELAEEYGEVPQPKTVWQRLRERLDHMSRSSVLRPVMATAASCAVALIFIVSTTDYSRPGGATGQRAAKSSPVVSLIADRTVMSREQFILRWKYEGEATFDVQVTTESLTEVAFVEDLAASEAEFDKSKFADFEPGTVLRWRVVVHPAKGEQFSSHAFRVVLE